MLTRPPRRYFLLRDREARLGDNVVWALYSTTGGSAWSVHIDLNGTVKEAGPVVGPRHTIYHVYRIDTEIAERIIFAARHLRSSEAWTRLAERTAQDLVEVGEGEQL